MKYPFDLEDFAARHLGGDVERLAELSLGTILAHPQVYGASVLGGDDCDDTNLAWEVYYRLWCVERFRKPPVASSDGTECKGEQWMRGDTMNSFRTLFGREIAGGGLDSGRVVGFKETPVQPQIVVDAIVESETNLEVIARGEDMTVVAELANGKVYTLSGAFLGPQSDYAPEDGTVSLTFQGIRGDWS